MTHGDVTGKVVLVTGAGSGLGEATAWAFATAGYAVACLDIDGEAVRRVSRELAAADRVSFAIPCDVRDADAVGVAVAAVIERFGRLDVVVNCAAVDHTCWVEDLSIEQWDHVIAVNLRGPFLVAKAALPAMRRQGVGHIVNVASTAAIRAWSGASAYHASKFGLLGFGRGLSVEARRDNVRVTTVIPGGMRTHFFDRFVEQGIPLPDEANLQDPANVAEAILFAVQLPAGSILQELVITPPNEPSWP